MPKAETTFRPIGDSEQRMFGNTALIVSGFPADEQKQLRDLMDSWGLADIPMIYLAESSLELTLDELTALPAETNAGETPKLPRALIMSGLQERQLNTLMGGYRQSGLERPMWASVTPNSSKWTIKYLLIELIKEREAMRQATLAQQQTDNKDTTDNPA